MKPTVKKVLPHLSIIALFLIISCVYFAPVFDGKVIQQGDSMKSDAMAKEQGDFFKKTGKYTSWTSSMFSGMPSYQIATKPQPTIFAPLKSILIMRPMGLERNIGVLFLYLIGFYICLLVLGVNPWLSLLGALAFGLGSYNIIIIEAGHITKGWAMAMIAPILAGMLLVFKRKYLWGGILFTLAVGLQITFNHIQITYYTVLTAFILAIIYFIFAIKNKEIKSFAIGVCVLLIGCIFIVATNARQLGVNLEYAKYTMRGGSEISVTPAELYQDNETKAITGKTSGLDIDYAFSWSYGKGETFTLLVPGLYGGGSMEHVSNDSEFYQSFRQSQAPLYWGDQPFTSGPVYFGAIIVFLFVLGMMIVKGPERWWILAATILAILMSWGRNFMGFNEFLFNNLPFYNKFRTPSMSLVIANVTMVILAILALKTILNKEVAKKQLQKALYIATGITGGICFLFILFAGSFSYTGASDTQMAAQYGQHWSQILDVLMSDRKSLLVSDSWRSLLLILLSAATLWLFINEKIKKQYLIIAILACLVVFDLWGVDKRYLNEKNFVKKSNTQLQPTQDDLLITEYAKANGDKDYRVFNIAVNTFNDSYPSAFHHQLGGYHAAKLRRYQDIIDFYLSRHINPNILNMLNARYFVVPNGERGTAVQRNPDALGSAWFVDAYQLVADPNAEILALYNFNPADTAIVDRCFSAMLEGKNLERDSNSVIEIIPQDPYNPDYLLYKTKTTKDQLAVFSEIYYAPDWRVYIDGKPAEYFRANYVLRAMVIPAGEHTIEFKNEAPLMHKLDNVALVSSIVLVLVIAGGIVFYYWRRKKK